MQYLVAMIMADESPLEKLVEVHLQTMTNYVPTKHSNIITERPPTAMRFPWEDMYSLAIMLTVKGGLSSWPKIDATEG